MNLIDPYVKLAFNSPHLKTVNDNITAMVFVFFRCNLGASNEESKRNIWDMLVLFESSIHESESNGRGGERGGARRFAAGDGKTR